MSQRIYRFPDLKPAGVPFHRVYVAKLEKQRKFPKHFNYGPNSVAWVADEIDAWVQARIASRDAEPVPATPSPPEPEEDEALPPGTPHVHDLLNRLIDRLPYLTKLVEQSRRVPIRHKPPGRRGRPPGAKDRRPRQQRIPQTLG